MIGKQQPMDNTNNAQYRYTRLPRAVAGSQRAGIRDYLTTNRIAAEWAEAKNDGLIIRVPASECHKLPIVAKFSTFRGWPKLPISTRPDEEDAWFLWPADHELTTKEWLAEGPYDWQPVR